MSEPIVDLRSDTVTRPTAAMRQAMATAEVGDDLLGDDPTVKKLEARVAELLGKEAALFFPSGTMANQTALATQGRWGGEVIVEAGAHIFHWEEGAAAALSGLQLRTVQSEAGAFDPETLREAIRPNSRYQPETALICLENTHLNSGGRVLSPEAIDTAGEIARERGIPVHLDGARLWHAPAATGRPLTEYTRSVDTVMVCLSKGLGAPVGSMLAGPTEVMERAWRVRRRLGGAMRQSGIIAAGGLHAIEHHRERLSEDHDQARRLAAGFREITGLQVDDPQTNVVLVGRRKDGPDLQNLLVFLEDHGILMLPFGSDRIRAVTHMDVEPQGISRVLAILTEFGRN